MRSDLSQPSPSLDSPPAGAEAGAAEDAATEFVAAVAHDLLDPLTTISGYLDLFIRRHGPDLTEGGRELVTIAREGAHSMQLLVQAMVDLNVASADLRSALAPVDLGAVVNNVALSLSAAVDEACGTIVVEPLPTVAGDQLQLARLFQNLIANALKFRAAGVAPVVRIEARLDPQLEGTTRDGWVFSVTDNGIGISPEQRDVAFGALKRLNPKSKYAGSGLGLAICKRIVEGHGGHIWVEDAPGGGSSFRFTLASGQ